MSNERSTLPSERQEPLSSNSPSFAKASKGRSLPQRNTGQRISSASEFATSPSSAGRQFGFPATTTLRGPFSSTCLRTSLTSDATFPFRSVLILSKRRASVAASASSSVTNNRNASIGAPMREAALMRGVMEKPISSSFSSARFSRSTEKSSLRPLRGDLRKTFNP